MNLLNNTFKKPKKLLLLITITVSLVLVFSIFQGTVLRVSAAILPIVADLYDLTFGTVFPGEQLEKTFEVSYTDNEGDIDYRIIHKIKPIDSGDSDYCQQNPNDFQKCYRNLCPYLTEFSNENEGDTRDQATVGAQDIHDDWIVRLKVPAIFGYVGQDHIGGVVSENGVYGCDISIDIIEPFLIDTITVPSDGNVVNSSVILENGEQYLLEASGTYEYWPDQLPDAGIADAKYSLRPEGSFNPGPGPQWISGDALPSPWTNYLEVLVNDVPMAWGIYSSSHIYSINYTGIGSIINFKILDDHYSDNSGSITVKIYQLP